eukprot:5220848-Prymnesium_polylepis.3
MCRVRCGVRARRMLELLCAERGAVRHARGARRAQHGPERRGPGPGWHVPHVCASKTEKQKIRMATLLLNMYLIDKQERPCTLHLAGGDFIS